MYRAKHIVIRSFLLLLLLLSTRCRKDVVLDLPDYTQKVVVEGSIETGGFATVFLSYSVPYFGEFDYRQPEKAFIKGAVVVVSDGATSETLREMDPKTGYVYMGSKLIGRENHDYTIQITVDGKTFETHTRIGSPVPLDSLYFKIDHDSLGLMWQTFTEPEGSGNCYRWTAKRLHKDLFFASPFNSVFDDKFIDGKKFDFGYERGPQPNNLQANREDPERGYYKIGDTVVVKFSTIGRREYDFWYTYYQNKSSNGNPFSAPSNIKSMFQDYENAFGAFVGYAPAFDTLIITKN